MKFLYAVLRAQFLIKKNSFAKIEKALEKDNKYFFLNLVQNKFVVFVLGVDYLILKPF